MRPPGGDVPRRKCGAPRVSGARPCRGQRRCCTDKTKLVTAGCQGTLQGLCSQSRTRRLAPKTRQGRLSAGGPVMTALDGSVLSSSRCWLLSPGRRGWALSPEETGRAPISYVLSREAGRRGHACARDAVGLLPPRSEARSRRAAPRRPMLPIHSGAGAVTLPPHASHEAGSARPAASPQPWGLARVRVETRHPSPLQ